MSQETKLVEDLLRFIQQSPSTYHVINTIREILLEQGFQEIREKDVWKLKEGQDYFVIRNDSSVIAFRQPEKQPKGFHIIASHSDSPTFKIKDMAEMTVEEKYIKLNTEKYGGMILSTWMDRSLSVAGRIAVRASQDTIETRLVNIDKDLLIIPNLAIHMNREINDGYKYNPQVDMLPLMALGGKEDAKDMLLQEVALAAGVNKEDILGHDLFLYVREKGRVVGANGEFVVSPKLDDLQCVHASLKAFVETVPQDYVNVLAVFDNEEVGSATAQGADSTFLADVLRRINGAWGMSEDAYLQMVAESFLISADNAHAVHPNHPEKADPTNRPYLGGGIVIKYHGSQRYTTDAVSAARMKLLCEKAQVPYQTYANRSDIVGGSTLGNISNAHVSLSSVDIGLPQLSMHSAVETAAGIDSSHAVKAFTMLYQE